MPEQNKVWLDNTTLKVMTYKSGTFIFQLGVDLSQLKPMLDRINDAQHRFNKMPGLAQIIDQIQEKILVSSIYSTNTIEGGQFTEQETEEILRQDPKTIQKSAERRLTNLKEAIEWIKQHRQTIFRPESGQVISLQSVIHLHSLVSQNLAEQHNPAGQFRNNQPGQKTIVGNDDHGGTYRPPKCIEDIEYLMQAWVEWLNHPEIITQPAIVRSGLAHYYFELIHPFWDGNGRTGRLIEMLLLEQSGYHFSSSAIWRYYQSKIDEYFALFNACRKSADKKKPLPNKLFIEFMLQGMFDTINYLHDQSNDLINYLLYQTALNNAKFNKKISDRQFNLVQTLIIIRQSQKPLSQAELYRMPQIRSLYSGKTERTFYRDIAKLIEYKFLNDQDGVIVLAG